MMITLSDNAERFLELYAEHKRHEPPEPDPDRHSYEETRLIARRRDEWEREENALWLMISNTLARQAVDEYPDAI